MKLVPRALLSYISTATYCRNVRNFGPFFYKYFSFVLGNSRVILNIEEIENDACAHKT